MRNMPAKNANPSIAELNSLFHSEFETTAQLYTFVSLYLGRTVTNWAQLYDALIAIYEEETNSTFSPRTYDYSISDDSLLVQERLPASKGSNPLSGVYNGLRWEQQQVKDTNKVYTFTGASYTFIDNTDYIPEPSHQGTFAWNTDRKEVYFRPSMVNDQTIGEYYTAAKSLLLYYDESRFPTFEDYCAAETNSAFEIKNDGYDTAERIIGWNN
jgi:hypothetical protein